MNYSLEKFNEMLNTTEIYGKGKNIIQIMCDSIKTLIKKIIKIENELKKINLSDYETKADLIEKLKLYQLKLISGTNIKTINEETLLGTGNINIEASSLHNYSTDEQVIGTWIDGKPLYEKTIVVTSDIRTNAETQIPHGVSNIDYRTFISGIIERSTGDHTPIPSTSIGGAAYYNGVENISDTAIIFWCGSLNGASITKLTATIRYTKTTD